MQKVLCLFFVIATSVTVISKIRSLTWSKVNYRNFHSFRPRVLQGWSDINDEYPFVVTLVYISNQSSRRACTASLITKQWVLTAAHCINPYIRYIRCGNMSVPWRDTKCKSKVLKMIMHPAYLNTKKSIKHDIALALVDEIVIRKFGKIHSADYKSFMGRAVRFAGFGATYHSYKFSEIGQDKAFATDEKKPLQIGEGVIFDNEIKDDNVIGISPKCTNIHQSPYFGDSGGPLFVDNKIVGVLSRGDSDHSRSKHFVNAQHPERNYYTAVSPYLDWIKTTINSNH